MPESTRTVPADGLSVWVLGGLAARLALVLYAVQLYHVEAMAGFLCLTPLIFGGFVVHALLPLRWRLPFFVVLSVAALGWVLGPVDGGLVLLAGLGLLGLCHLPLSFGWRVALVVGAAALLAGLRAGVLAVPALPTLADGVLPVLAGLFMFRLMIYLYDLRHERKPATVWERLAYFFLLPNVCFPLFPVVDYRTFRRTYYDTHEAAIYRTGIRRLFRGVTHLLAYRILYLFLVPDPSVVAGAGPVLVYMVATYGLYLRISGLFHLITGVLALFGFNLPETYRHYYLADSFNDYWRRINIYWKDFMLKLFYYPALMRLRNVGPLVAIAGGVVAVFAATWFLHGFQWFWLRGDFPVTAPDVLFWSLFALLMVANSLYEAKRGRKQGLGAAAFHVRPAAVRAVRVVALYAGITVLWTLWSSLSLAEFGSLMRRGGVGLAGLMLAAGAALAALSVGWQWLRSRWTPPATDAPVLVGAALLVLLALAYGHGHLGPAFSARMEALVHDRTDQRDAVLRNRGYYEGLLAPGGFRRFGDLNTDH